MTGLELTEVASSIGAAPVLHNVSLSIEPDQVLVLVGRNGAGKTTTLRTIMGMTNLTHGDITFCGRSLNGLQPHEVAALGIGYVPEGRGIFGDLSVEENLKVAEKRRGQLESRREFLYSLFPPLEALNKRAGSHLSGGEQQMLSIARALVPDDNRLLLIDEPFEGLAPVIVHKLAEALASIAKSTMLLLVEQNIRTVAAIADKFTVVADGRTVLDGTAADVAADEFVFDSWLGVS